MRHTLARWLSVISVSGALSATADETGLDLPAGIETRPDGRASVEDLYSAYLSLQRRGWILDVVFESQPEGRDYALPIIALRTPATGEAVWILSGIHGEETAGPNAIAAIVDDLARLGETRPLVVLPLNNPHGYVNDWRYLNTPVYSEAIEGQSVGDSSHLLPDRGKLGQPRASMASSPEADALTSYVVRMTRAYPPEISIDLHEDDLIDAGYVYSQGALGGDDPLAALAVETLASAGIPLKMDGETRFGEPIDRGVIGPVEDSSIDELMSAGRIVVDGAIVPGPSARTVLVFETPAAGLPLDVRVQAHAALLQRIAARMARPAGKS